jgi:hypothetical protein
MTKTKKKQLFGRNYKMENYDMTLVQNLAEPLKLLTMFYNKSESEILKIGILTNIAFETLPNYKNYTDLISGVTQARMMKGVNGRNYIESQVKKLFETYELNDINENIVEKAIELIVLTFDSVYLNSGEKTKNKYIEALEDFEFLYINLKLSVKIVAETLRRKNITLSNLSLHFITEQIKREKRNIADEYIKAYASNDEKQLKIARNNYRETMERMLNNFIKSLMIPYEAGMQLNREQEIVNKLGKENLDKITMYMLREVKTRVLKNKQIQLKFDF